jgi:hypothetical protein
MVTDTSRGGWRRALMGEHEVGLAALLTALLGPPVAWTLHFVVLYFLVALYCTTGRTDIVLETAVATVIAAGLSVGSGVLGYRRWREVRGEGEWLDVMAEGATRSAFLLLMGVLGAAFFTLVIVMEALPPLFVPTCAAGGG